MIDLLTKPLVVVDIETTGANPFCHDVLAIGNALLACRTEQLIRTRSCTYCISRAVYPQRRLRQMVPFGTLALMWETILGTRLWLTHRPRVNSCCTCSMLSRLQCRSWV